MSASLLRVQLLCVLLVLAFATAKAQNNWIGPYDSNWNNAGNWSLGTVPGPGDDVVIYSGGYDWVVLDPGSASIKSLTLGGTYNGTSSELGDNGLAQSLTIANSLFVGQTGYLYLTGGTAVTAGADSINAGTISLSNGSSLSINRNLDNMNSLQTFGGGSAVNVTGTLTNDPNAQFSLNGSGDVANAGFFVNNGNVYVGPYATLNLTNQPSGITDVVAGSGFAVSGAINNVMNSTSAFANLTSIEGYLNLGISPQFGYFNPTTITPAGGTLSISNTGNMDASYGADIQVTGNIDNFGFLTTSAFSTLYGYYYGPNTLGISGTLTNEAGAHVSLYGNYNFPDTATVSTLVNYGNVYVGPYATLNLTNQPSGITDIVAGSGFAVSGAINNVMNSTSAFANLTSIEGYLNLGISPQYGYFNPTTITPAGGTLSISNTGNMDASYGADIQVTGNVDNFGSLTTSRFSNLFGYYYAPNTLRISGTLTNEAGAQFSLYGNYYYPDTASVGTLTNLGNVYVGPYATLDPMRVDNFSLITINGTTIVGTGTPGGPGYYQFANGTLGEHVDMSAFGVVVVNSGGAVNLNGTLDILLQPGFNPTIGSAYDFVMFSPGDLVGTFASLQNATFNGGTEKWVVIYDDASGYVELLAQSNNSIVPEPSSFLLLGTGLLSLACRIRYRWTSWFRF